MPTSSANHVTAMPSGMGRMDLRDLLLVAGVGEFLATGSIPYMNFLPATCEPYASGVVEITKGLQRLLNMRGASLAVDGGMGKQMVGELKKFAGPLWYEKSWAQLYTDVLAGKQWNGFKRSATGRYGVAVDRAYGRRGNLDEIDTAYGAEQGMGSYMHGLGADDPLASQWTLRSGVAIPLTMAMLAYFQSIQRAVNGINAKLGWSLIGVDGRIGNQTSDAVARIAVKYGSDPWINTKITPTYLANGAPSAVSELMTVMQQIGATYVADPKTSSQPSVAKPDGTIANPPDGMSTTTLVIGAVAIGAVIAVLGKKKRRK